MTHDTFSDAYGLDAKDFGRFGSRVPSYGISIWVLVVRNGQKGGSKHGDGPMVIPY